MLKVGVYLFFCLRIRLVVMSSMSVAEAIRVERGVRVYNTWSLIEMKRIVKRVVRLEIEELYMDGSSMSDVIEVRTTDEVDRAKSIEELTMLAKKELTKNE